jgi:HSP20 family protein
MSLVRWEPFRNLRRRDDAFDDLFREFFRGPLGEPEAVVPAVEVSEANGDVTVKMEVPGFEKDQVHVSVADDVLTVRGEARKEERDEKKNYYRQEIRYGAFQRMVPLPVEVDGAKAKAELKNGVLTLTMPKARAPKANEIKVSVG